MRPEDRNRSLLWEGLRLAVVDLETVWDPGGFAGPAREETDRAIETVREYGEPVVLAPQPRAVRRAQHATIEAAGLASASHGEEPRRAVEVRLRAEARALSPARPTPSGGEVRAASIALVECAHGAVGETWYSLVNPGVPVDRESARYHKLTDAQLAASPPFATLAPEILRRLTPREGETLVLVGHNVGYDLAVLRSELRRAGLVLPELPVLDTKGKLAARAGRKAGRTLGGLLSDLGLRNEREHQADTDARATAAAACVLLGLVADRGDYDITSLLADLGGLTTISFPSSRPGHRAKSARQPRFIRPEHAAAHMALTAEAAPEELRCWIGVADECARLRCPELAGDPVSSVAIALAAGVAPTLLLDALAQVVELRAAATDGPGAATALDAIGLVFDLCCPVPLAEGSYPFERQPTIELWHRLRRATVRLRRCDPEHDACPRCAEGQPCGRDELVRRMAPGAGRWRWHEGRLVTSYSISHWLPSTPDKGWFVHRHTRSRRGGRVRGAFAGGELADAIVGWLLRTYRAYGEEPEPAKVVAYQINRVIEAGACGEPWFWEMVALEWARPGRETDLCAAIEACEKGLEGWPEGTTASAWIALRRTRELLDLRLATVRRGPAVRHHPGPNAQRAAVLRFA